MSGEITHRRDPNTGHMRQIVPPWRLRQMLDEDGDSYDPPDDWTDDDEWDVGE